MTFIFILLDLYLLLLFYIFNNITHHMTNNCTSPAVLSSISVLIPFISATYRHCLLWLSSQSHKGCFVHYKIKKIERRINRIFTIYIIELFEFIASRTSFSPKRFVIVN